MQPTRLETQAWYDKLSPFYDLISDPWEKASRQEGVRLLNPQPGEICLDIGCGTGHGIAAMVQAAGSGVRVYGLDLSMRMLRVSAERVNSLQISSAVMLVAGDATCLPFGKETFNAIFASYSIELFRPHEMPLLLQEFRKALQPNGRLCAVSLSKSGKSLFMRQLYIWAQRLFPKWIDCRPIHLAQALVTAGFTLDQVHRRNLLDLPVEIVLAKRGES